MVKDFNELLADEHEFRVRDVVFRWDDVRPEVLSEFNNDVDPDNPNAVWDLMDRQILLFIVPDDREKWAELRKRDKEPVTIKQVTAVVSWLMEQQTPVPTEQPSPSEPGRGSTAPTSTAG